MKCPNCGEEIRSEGAPFCPSCGMNLEAKRTRRKLRFVIQDDMRFRHLAAAAVIVVVVVAVLSVLLVELGSEEGDAPLQGNGPSASAINASAGYIELGGDFSDGTLTAYLDNSGQLRISLSSEAAEGFSSFVWVLRDDIDNSYQYITKDVDAFPDPSSITWMSPTVGEYTLTVTCIAESEERTVYIGDIDYYGDCHDQHRFVYGDSTYTVYADVTLEEFTLCRTAATDGRNVYDAASAASFIVTDGAAAIMESNLRAAYERVNGTASADLDYASYILAFVRSCITDRSDTSIRGQATYWAYPAETLFLGAGDEGDRAVLAASLLGAAGFPAGIVVLPGLTAAAVSIDRYTTPQDVPDGYRVVRVISDGVYYCLCDVNDDVPVGCVDDAYSCTGGRFYRDGAYVGSQYGLALPNH